jgi:glycosyl transferase family 87
MGRRGLSIGIVCVFVLGVSTPAWASRTASTRAHALASTGRATDPNAPAPVSPSDIPPVGRRLSSNRVLAIADRLPKLRAARASHPGSYGGAYLKGPGRWQVSYFSRKREEIGQAIVSDASGRVLEQWTGFQIAWSMARGYPGAFGRHSGALYVWLPLCLLFFVPFFDWRKPLRLLHLDLLVLLSFSISLAFFNHADIGASTPLAYPPLVYLLVRMLVLCRRPRPAAPEQDPHRAAAGRRRTGPPLRLLVPAPWLAVGVVFLLAFRIALNVTDSNVIDVGYAGVIGAQRIAHEEPLYRHYPPDNERGDTYGPVNYEAYVPFQQIFGWSGRWDDLPAAHAAAIFFDLLAIGLLFLLGRRVRGPSLGIALAYAWVSYPFTLFTLESNSNDALVGALVLAALLAAAEVGGQARRRSHGRARSDAGGWARRAWTGALTVLAGMTKLAPLALAPLFATHGLRGLTRRRQAGALCAFGAAFVLVGALACVPAFTHDSLHTVLRRTIVYQANRQSPFSIWGFYGGLGAVQKAVGAGAVLLALALALVPRRPDLVGLAAAAAAVLVAVQLSASHWFYLYIPWFFGTAMLALLGALSEPPQQAGEASGSARSSQLAVA